MTDRPIIDARRIRRLTGRLPFASGKGVTLRPVVALRSHGRDCDGYDIDEVTYVLPNEVDSYIDHSLQWADGPMGFEALTLADLELWYEQREDRQRHHMRCGWDDDRF